MDYLLQIDEQDNLEISPYALTIKQFRGIWERDKKKNKPIAVLELAFVYYCADLRSIYNKQGLSDSDKASEIPKDIGLPAKWKPDELIKAAITKYEELHLSQAALLVKDAQVGVNKLRKFFTSIDLLQTDDKGKPVYNINQFTTAIKQIRPLNKELNEAYKDILSEIEEGGKIYGGENLAMFEDPED